MMLSPTAIGLWMTNMVLECSGQIAFKAATKEPRDKGGLAGWRHMAARRFLWIGAACYAACFLVWMAFVSVMPLSVGVLLSSINIVALMLAGRWVFGERLTPLRVVGIGLVTVGVAVVGYGP
jgi:drug/metabolite transporter (DMT)-like permease